MKQHPYQYKILVEYLNPVEKGRTAHFTHEDAQESLTGTIEEVFAHLPESIAEGWEVNSHNITVSRDTMILTFLLRRPVAS